MKKWLALAPLAVLCYMPTLAFAQTDPTVQFSVSEYIAIDQSAVANFKIDNHKEGNVYAIKVFGSNAEIEILHPDLTWKGCNLYSKWAELPTITQESASITYRVTSADTQLVTVNLRLHLINTGKNLVNPIAQTQELVSEAPQQITIYGDDAQPLIDAQEHYLVITNAAQTQLYSSRLDFYSDQERYITQMPSMLNSASHTAYLLDRRNQIVSSWPLEGTDTYLYTLSIAYCEALNLPPHLPEFSRITLLDPECSDMQSTFAQSNNYMPEYPLKAQIKQLFFNNFNYYASRIYSIASEQIELNLINEFNPLGQEWVELYNDTEFELSLCGFYLDDIEGGSSPILLSDNCIIMPKSYLVINLSKNILNDDGDTCRLLSPLKMVRQAIPYQQGTGQSFARFASSWQWTDTATPLATNILSTYVEPSTPSPSTPSPEPTNEVAVEILAHEIATYIDRLVIISGQLTLKSGDSWWIKDETGSAKIFFQPKQNLSKPVATLGDKLRVTGWVSIYRGVYRIIPASSEQVEVFSVPKVSASKVSLPKKTTKLSASSAEQAPAVLVATVSNIDEMDISSYQRIAPPPTVEEHTNNDFVLKTELLIAIISLTTLSLIAYAKLK